MARRCLDARAMKKMARCFGARANRSSRSPPGLIEPHRIVVVIHVVAAVCAVAAAIAVMIVPRGSEIVLIIIMEPHRIVVVVHVVAAVCTAAAAIAATIVPRGNEIVSSGHRRWGTVLVGDAVHGALRELPWGRRSRTACRARRLRSSRNSSSIVIHVVAIIASVVNGCSYRRLKPRQRHRIAVVIIHVVPRSSSDLTARRPRASSIIIIITSLLGFTGGHGAPLPPAPATRRAPSPRMVHASTQALADALQAALQAALPISAKQQWSDGTHGARTFMAPLRDPPAQGDWRDSPDWEGLQANAHVLRAIVPHVRERRRACTTAAAKAVRTWVERCGLEGDEKSIHQQARQMSTMASWLRRLHFKYHSGRWRCKDGDDALLPLVLEMKPGWRVSVKEVPKKKNTEIKVVPKKKKVPEVKVVPKKGVEKEVPKKKNTEIKVEVRVVVVPERADAAPGRRVSVAQSSTRAPRTGGPHHQEKRPSSPPDASTFGAGRPEASTKKRRQTLSLD